MKGPLDVSSGGRGSFDLGLGGLCILYRYSLAQYVAQLSGPIWDHGWIDGPLVDRRPALVATTTGKLGFLLFLNIPSRFYSYNTYLYGVGNRSFQLAKLLRPQLPKLRDVITTSYTFSFPALLIYLPHSRKEGAKSLRDLMEYAALLEEFRTLHQGCSTNDAENAKKRKTSTSEKKRTNRGKRPDRVQKP